MVDDGEGQINFNRKPKEPIIGFYDIEKVGGILKKIFPLVISVTMASFNVSLTLIH